MNANWEIKKLGDIITLQRGHDLPSQDRKHGQVPIMGSSGITGYHNQFKAKGPGVIIGRSGNSMGQVSYISENYWPLNTCLYVTDFKGNCPEFIYYFLKQINFEQFNSGSAQKSLNRNAVYPFEVKFPTSYKVQSKIASTLFALENKINLNQDINQTLEQMAQALFKSWFVDFEPVKAKIAVLEAGGSQEDAALAAMTAISGKDADSLTVFEQEHPEKYAELRATAELFPSTMQDIESVKIPEGWYLVPLRKIASFASGKSNVSELTKDTYISTENMLVNKMGIECATSLPSASTTPSFNPGHILISNIRPYFKKIWLARFLGGRSADVLAFEHKKHITAEYLYNILYQDSFFDFMMQTSKGVKMPRGDKKAIMEWSCIEPDIRLVKLFSNKVKEFYSYIESHNRENTLLSQLRDTLLPKLLSGEIILPEVEELAKEADYV
ncbi:restriction endonuclease subunit S [Citrobacter freundii]|uniref:restriction endonuclease subunit S n=1 Tax=Citrobacter freundii TaxID=546 RepID=UPI001BCD1E44|nr:restriction endonuclease subunit S [Citrobacter freundii]MDT7067147.1 restriction endonuclease subunit S [Citrobacter freundii]MDT7082200.1 restriction endonuclease subunit S [Citrobacter freundii]MDT7107111.1 restriction endonuclease subunit S [Citrobacter freundii]MDT7109873.1 restriction endonuclease subunit S [Citrobacter freundii]MDT7122036.1 restriction endonuclease subunit S [Citrobacter freundii]